MAGVDYWSNAGEIYSGVKVGSVDLGGKTPSEARKIVKAQITGPLQRIELNGPQNFTRSAKQMGIEFDVDATVQKAYDVGRKGNIFERIYERVEAAFGAISIPTGVSYQPGVAKKQVMGIASQLNQQPRDASVSIDGSDVKVVDSRKGFETDVAATMDNVKAAVNGTRGEVKIEGKITDPKIHTPAAESAAKKARAAMSEPLVVSYQGKQWGLTTAQVGEDLDVNTSDGNIQVSLNRDRLGSDLDQMVSDLTSQPVEADFSVQGSDVTVTPSQNGQTVEKQKLLDTITNNIFKGQHQYDVPVKVNEPDLTTSEAEKLKPTQVIGSYTTNYLTYSDSQGRVTNLKKASAAVDGTILAPGQTFSFNKVAEPIHYAKTKVIINGKVDHAEGGGLCQVSTNLYMAANYAGLDVIERHPHYAELPYIRPGFDATVWFGLYDMKFVNNTNAYVLLREWVDTSTGDVHAEIWGQPTGKKVTMSSKEVKDTPKETKWITYKTITQNGKVIQSGVLHEDTYQPLEE